MQWISVKDRLPEEYDRVLAVVDVGCGAFQCVAWFNGKHWHSYESETDLDVTHWMPLPELPLG